MHGSSEEQFDRNGFWYLLLSMMLWTWINLLTKLSNLHLHPAFLILRDIQAQNEYFCVTF